MSEDLDISMRCVQYMLFVSNFLFVMVALLLISIGTIIKSLYIDFEIFLETSFFSPSTLLIVSGFIIFFVAFFGCWGAIKESTLVVNVYALFLFIILVLEILAAVTAITMRIDLKGTITGNMETLFENVDHDTNVRQAFDFTQSQLFCCGIHNQSDWKNVPPFNTSQTLFPESCCSGYDFFQDQTNNGTCDTKNIPSRTYGLSCADEVTELISQTAYLLTSGAICVAFIQVIGIIFARLLSNTIRSLKTQRLVEAELRRQQIYSQIILEASLNAEGDDNNNKTHSTASSDA